MDPTSSSRFQREVSVDRKPFSRAKEYLRSAPGSKWLAILSAIGVGISHLVLLLLLFLFADLIVSRGYIPTFSQLSREEQKQFVDRWKSLSDEDRKRINQQIRSVKPSEEGADKKSVSTDLVQKLLADELPPLPFESTEDKLTSWAKSAEVMGDRYVCSLQAYELRWQGYLWYFLSERVSPEAADSYLQKVIPDAGYLLPNVNGTDRKNYGILSLVVRERESYLSRMVGFVARFCSWSWLDNNETDSNQRFLLGLLIASLCVGLARFLFIIIMEYCAAKASIEGMTKLRRSIYQQTLRLGQFSVQRSTASETTGLFTKHVEALQEALYLSITSAIHFPLQLFFSLVVIVVLHPLLGIASLLFALLIWYVGGQIANAFQRLNREANRKASNRQVMLLESIKIMRLVKGYLMEPFNQTRLERQLNDYKQITTQRYRYQFLGEATFLILGLLGSILLLFWAGRIVLGGNLTAAGVFVLCVTMITCYFPIQAHFEQRKYIRRGQESASVLFEFLNRKSTVPQYVDAEFMEPLSRHLDFKNVTLRDANTGKLILEEATFQIKAGQQVGIVGSEKAEKMAILYLIPRFLDPSSGDIKADGKNLKYVTLDSLRAQIGLILQKDLIFSDTVANNIGCGDPSFTLPQIIEASKLAHAHQFIQKLPYGYETPIGELGEDLDAGQRFRIALARAILRDPAIMIIEEPEEPYDDDTKALIDDTMDRIRENRTLIVIPHRISTLKKCSQILLIHKGSIAATGQHKDLLSSNDLYRHLYYQEFHTVSES